MPDLPLKVWRDPFLHQRRLDRLLDADEHPRPEGGHEQLPVQVGQRMDLFVAMYDLILISTLGVGEVSDSIVQVG